MEFFSEGGQQIKINGFNTTIVVTDILVERYPGLPENGYKCTVNLEVDLSAPHNENLETKFTTGANSIFFNLHRNLFPLIMPIVL